VCNKCIIIIIYYKIYVAKILDSVKVLSKKCSKYIIIKFITTKLLHLIIIYLVLKIFLFYKFILLFLIY